MKPKSTFDNKAETNRVIIAKIERVFTYIRLFAWCKREGEMQPDVVRVGQPYVTLR